MTESFSVNTKFYEKVERSLQTLFDAARNKNELHFALSLVPEMRGMQDAGWDTAAEAHRAFDEYHDFVNKPDQGRLRHRVALAFYCHIAEASGFYEVPKNMLRVAGGESHVLCPFSHLVDAHRITGDRIAPNTNKVLKDLVGHAHALGFVELAEVFRDAFDGDIRNGYAHADYVIWTDGLRLCKRNGGHARCVPWEEFMAIFERGINFFQHLRDVVGECVHSYEQPRTIRARLQNEPESDWTIYYCKSNGAFGITQGKYEPNGI